MKRDADILGTIDERMDALLIAWYGWEPPDDDTRPRGFASQSATCKDYRTPTHWDWQNGVLDGRDHEIQMKGVDESVSALPNEPKPLRTMIEFEAKNLSVGYTVWKSPRLPVIGEEFEILRLEARNALLKQLYHRGVMGG